MCVANDGQREPRGAQLVLDRLDELGHRRRRAALAARPRPSPRVAIAMARAITSSSRVRLDPPQPVDERRAVDERSTPGERPRELDRGLAPRRVHRARPGPARRPRAPPRRRPARRVSLTTTTSPAACRRGRSRRTSAGRRRAAPGPGAKNAPVDPAVRVGELAEARQVALDAGQVLEVGRRLRGRARRSRAPPAAARAARAGPRTPRSRFPAPSKDGSPRGRAAIRTVGAGCPSPRPPSTRRRRPPAIRARDRRGRAG